MVQSGSAYVRQNYGNKRLSKGSSSNKPIVTIYKKKRYGKKQPKTAMNKEAIMKISKQVKTLQLQRFGSVQWQTQFTTLNSAIPTAFPSRLHPVLFCVNSIYNNTALYRGNVDPAGEPQGLILPAAQYWRKQDFRVDINNQYQWIPINNQEQVSQTQFLGIKSNLKITFDARIHQTARDPVKFRVTFFSLRKQPSGEQPNSALMTLPDNLGAYWNMAADNPEDRNYFSKVRHKVLYDRWVVFNPPSNNGAVSSLNKTMTYSYKFPELKPLAKDFHPVPLGQTFISSLPIDEVVWCMISSNYENLAGGDSVVNINMSRVNTWRDAKGVSTI